MNICVILERRILTNRICPDSDSSDDSRNGEFNINVEFFHKATLNKWQIATIVCFTGGRTDPSDETDESDLTDPSDETDESDQTDPSDENEESDEPRFFSDEDEDESDASVEEYTNNHENGGLGGASRI